MKNEIVVLLTATIDPKGVLFMQRNSPEVRERDYLEALRLWVEKTDLKIIFCENSGYSLDKIRHAVSELSGERARVEVLQFYGQNFPREYGKGYGELLTIRHAIETSEFSKTAKYLIKINGRYFVDNIESIVKPLEASPRSHVMADLSRNLLWGDSRVFAFTPDFVSRYLLKYQSQLNDQIGCYLEHLLAKAIHAFMADGGNWIPLPERPRIVGYSGTSNKLYQSSRLHDFLGEIVHRSKNYLIRR